MQLKLGSTLRKYYSYFELVEFDGLGFGVLTVSYLIRLRYFILIFFYYSFVLELRLEYRYN